MDTKETAKAKKFLEVVLADEGYYCVLGLSGGKPSQTFVSTIDALVSKATSIAKEKGDAFYGLATYLTPKNRTGENAKSVKSVWLDVDCGPDKPYTTYVEGYKAVKAFTEAYKLPNPWVVRSGLGLHIYWPFTRVLEPDDWHPIARALKAACKEHGLEADPLPTTDIARVLRVPGTFNYKNSPVQVQVQVLRRGDVSDPDIFKPLLPATAPAALPTAPVVASTDDSWKDDVTKRLLEDMNSRVNSFKAILKKSRNGKGCAQILTAVRNRNAVSEPLWRACLSVVYLCRNHEVNVQRISEGYEGKNKNYTVDETALKAVGTKCMPHGCMQFEDHGFKDDKGESLCLSCVNRGKIKTPLSLGRDEKSKELIEAALAPPPIEGEVASTTPMGFPTAHNYIIKTDDRGRKSIHRTMPGPEEKDILIYSHWLIVTNRYTDIRDGENIVVTHQLPHDDLQEFVVPLKTIYTSEFKETLASNGIIGSPKEIQLVITYITKYTQELQKLRRARKTFQHFGWVAWETDSASFLVGRQLFRPHKKPEDTPFSTYTERYGPDMHQMGSMDKWKELVQTVVEDCPERLFGFTFHVGSPLMVFSRLYGTAVNFVSNKSGTGKSAVLSAQASIWGFPGKLVIKAKDTDNSLELIYGIFHSLGTSVDEMTERAPKEISKSLLQISDGKGKQRMYGSRDQLRPNITSWAQGYTYTSNLRFAIKMQEGGAQGMQGKLNRIIEIDLTTPLKGGKAAVRDLNLNYGMAGVIYAQWLVENLDLAKELFYEEEDNLAKLINISEEGHERYWIAAGAMSIVGAKIFNRLFDFEFDVKGLRSYVSNVIIVTRKSSYAINVNPVDVINEYITEHWHLALTIDVSGKNPKHPEHATSDGTSVLTAPPHARGVRIRDEIDAAAGQTVRYIGKSHFNQWCTKQKANIDGQTIMISPDLGAKGGLTFGGTQSKRLTEGLIPGAGTKIACYQLLIPQSDKKTVPTTEHGT